MKNEELKLKAIQDAYGEYWEICNPDKNGWTKYSEVKNEEVNMHDSFVEFTDTCLDIELESWRPKSLSGIENNLGWIRIEEDGSNLPNGNDADDFWICNENGLFDFFSYHEQIARKFRNGTVTHYQPVIKPKPPIY